jgi:chaperonin GroES
MPRATAKPDEPTAPARATKRAPRAKKKVEPPAPEIRLTGDRLVVRNPDQGERKTAAGLLIPATAMPAPKRLQWGDVALVGPEVRAAAVGDRVLYLPSAGLEVELEGEDLVLLRERDVQAVSAAPVTKAASRSPGQYL